MRNYWCPACRCNLNDFVKAEAKQLLHERQSKTGKVGAYARLSKLSPAQLSEQAKKGWHTKRAKKQQALGTPTVGE